MSQLQQILHVNVTLKQCILLILATVLSTKYGELYLGDLGRASHIISKSYEPRR
eukprot:COSAG02_NODE_57606_length_280_cov_0.569061_1_plen_53_part_10